MAKATPKLMSDYFPERLYKFCVLRMNWVFKVLFKIAKLFMDKKTIKKIAILENESGLA